MEKETKRKLDYLFKVLSLAIVEIRVEAKENRLPKSYKLADLIHNLPGDIRQAISKEDCYEFDKVFERFEERVNSSKLSFWTENVKEHINFKE